MLERALEFSLRQRFVVVLGAILLVVLGILAWPQVNLDAVPDITTNQISINTETGGMSPEEVEKLVTFPIETAMGGIPGVEQVRSLSQFGLSQVNVVFRDDKDIYFARQLVSERLNGVKDELPDGVGSPTMGPVSTGLGDIYMYAIESPDRTPAQLRELQDWVIAPQLRTVPGVAEVNATDGSVKQYQVVVSPQAMLARSVSVDDVVAALQNNNENAGGGLLERNGERVLIRSVGLAQTTSDIEQIVVKSEDGVPVLIRDVASVELGVPVLTGISTKDGKESLMVIVMMLKGANGQTVANAVNERIDEIKGQLPKDVTLTTTYDRAEFVGEVLHTVEKSLLEGAALVIIVLVVLLGNFRGAIIAAIAIPLAMLFAVLGMKQFGISGNLMSLGAIDFGIIVDGAVIMVENCVRRLSEARAMLGRTLTKEEHAAVIKQATSEVRKVTQFGEMIIIATFIPILALEGVEGKMFRPMALVFILALVGALILSLTLIPTLCSLFLSRDTQEKHSRLLGFFERLYAPTLAFALKRRAWVIGAASVLLVACGFLFTRIGSEFVPKLDEGSLVIQPIRVRTVDMEQTIKLVTAYEKKVLEVPEVLTVVTRTGTPEIATDPMPLSLSDSFLTLKPKAQWRPGMTKEKLIAELQSKIQQVPGQGYNFSQPIELRFAEIVSGVKADVGIKVFGENLGELKAKADEIAALMQDIPGATDIEVEQVDDVPVFQIDIDREAIARLGISIADIQHIVSVALGGEEVGQIVEGDRRFGLAVRLPEDIRNDPEAIKSLRVETPTGGSVPLSSLATIGDRVAPAQISREMGKRRVVVTLNVRGRDLGSFIAEAQRKVKSDLQLDEGYYVTWGGQFENLQRASQRLTIVVPVALGLIFVLLFSTFGSMKQAALIFTGVPLAVTGGIIALAVRGMPFSITAGVGFIALSGVAVLNGVVMVSAINRLRSESGMSVLEAVRTGASQRLRPVLMTALVAALGFIPMALNTGIGAEVQRPLATVVIGGILSATLLTLVVLPVLYTWFEKDTVSVPEVT
ncbi:MAG TPA: CusA/CzcA family heavy metal efflux RND transporter [Fimbriimonadaceae bacterium]|nr:CusA/CzcA family heavy metal efflux RND transporter [Fimbriimonadaceae bacterium]HRE94604.1 CusA/CzcA family heavy metal efflux RND transporter [Fimbriimonadaceae bacterium]